MAWIAPVVAWIGSNAATIGTVASVASTAYSAYSSNKQEGKATSERHKSERAATLQQRKLDASAAEAAGLSEATRLRKRKVLASTIMTTPEGLEGKQTLGD
jgi:uncharacterized membrane protein YebE (DUF533 family)